MVTVTEEALTELKAEARKKDIDFPNREGNWSVTDCTNKRSAVDGATTIQQRLR